MKFNILILLLALTMPAQAETNSTDKQKSKKTVYKKTQEVSFDSADVDGLVRSPDGAYVNPKKGVKFMPLYKVDKIFDREIKNSVEYLR